MAASNFVSCVNWIRRGEVKERPDKVALTKDEIRRLLEGEDESQNLSAEAEGGDDDEEDKGEIKDDPMDDNSEENDDDELSKRYDLDDYDNVDSSKGSKQSSLTGLAIFAANENDPYMTVRDEDDESDEEDKIQADDNIIAVGSVTRDGGGVVQFYVFNERENDLFVHHDIMLATMPLCLQWVHMDDTNYMAVGGMGPAIELWDVDIIGTLEPALVLGGQGKKKRKKKHEKSKHPLCHTDAVLDLAWNNSLGTVLASGSSDRSVILWDMDKGLGLTSVFNGQFGEKVQSLSWHPFEQQNLLAGSCDHKVRLFDCRDPGNAANEWLCQGGEVEKVLWNHFDPFYFITATETGLVHYFDARGPSAPVWTLSAHGVTCSSISLSSKCPGLLVTSSTDHRIKIWDISGQPTFVHEAKLGIGKIFCHAGCPDSPFIVCAGGDERENNFKVVDIMASYPAVETKFRDRKLLDFVPTEPVSGQAVKSNSVEMDTSESAPPRKKLSKIMKN